MKGNKGLPMKAKQKKVIISLVILEVLIIGYIVGQVFIPGRNSFLLKAIISQDTIGIEQQIYSPAGEIVGSVSRTSTLDNYKILLIEFPHYNRIPNDSYLLLEPGEGDTQRLTLEIGNSEKTYQPYSIIPIEDKQLITAMKTD